MGALAADLTALAPAGDGASREDALARAAVAPPADKAAISERRRAALLVTIVSNYGSLVERTAAATASRLVAQVRDLAVDTARRHGGLVNQAIGEEIVCLFGVPAAHDDDELRAVSAALELHARVSELASNADGNPQSRFNPGCMSGRWSPSG